MTIFLNKFQSLIDDEVQNPDIWLAYFPSSKYFYIRALLEKKFGKRLKLKEIKKLLDKEFGEQARLDTHKNADKA